MINTNFPIYGTMILLSLLANIVVVMFVYKKYNFSKEEIIEALTYENIGIVFGATILSVLQNFNLYDSYNFSSVGFSSYGGLIGALIFLILFALQYKKRLKDMLFTFMPSIPLIYGIGKVGCFFAGCCYGIYYNGFGNIIYNYSEVAPNHVHLFPVQIVEAIIFILIFIYMLYRTLKNKFNWQTLGSCFVLCGLAKFGLDYFRMSHINTCFSINQFLSIIFILIGFVIIFKNKKIIIK